MFIKLFLYYFLFILQDSLAENFFPYKMLNLSIQNDFINFTIE